MPIKSYLVFPKRGEEIQLEQSLLQMKNCDVFPDKNKKVFALVAETSSGQEDEEFLSQLQSQKNLSHINLVSGFITEPYEQERV